MMEYKLRVVLLCSIFTTCLLGMLMISQKLPDLDAHVYKMLYPLEAARHYLIHSETCIIPNMDPYDPSVKRFINVRKHVKCPKWNFTTYLDGRSIRVNKTAVTKFFSNFSYCSYRPYVKRPNTDMGVNFIKAKFRNFTEMFESNDEFCFVYCYNHTGGLQTKQTYAIVLRNETLVKVRRSKLLHNDKENMPMSILVLGLESTSRLNAIRHLNMTRTFMKDELQAVELNGYTKIGGNTLPNVIPILLGKPIEEINDTRHFYDQYNFIWKDFKKSGYITHLSQDSINTAAFHYLSHGFRRAPVDHYMRPYVMSLEQTNRHGLCSGNTLVLQSMMDNIQEFATTYKDLPYFSFSFYGNPTHDNYNGLGVLDLPLFNLLTDLSRRSLLHNTVVIIVGDHGSRYGAIRSTYQGRMEENLPVLFIAVPKRFRQKHEDLYKNLKENANKLTSNLDIYATFHDVMELGKDHATPRVSGQYGTSLLRNISTTRTCKDLKIPQAFCMCTEFVKTGSNDSVLVNKTVHWVVGKINEILTNVSNVCETLAASKITRAWKSNIVSSLLKTHNRRMIDFVIQFEVSPSKATFDARIRYKFDTKDFTLLGDISRTNKYAGQSDCVVAQRSAVLLERYCYCKKLGKVGA